MDGVFQHVTPVPAQFPCNVNIPLVTSAVPFLVCSHHNGTFYCCAEGIQKIDCILINIVVRIKVYYTGFPMKTSFRIFYYTV